MKTLCMIMNVLTVTPCTESDDVASVVCLLCVRCSGVAVLNVAVCLTRELHILLAHLLGSWCTHGYSWVLMYGAPCNNWKLFRSSSSVHKQLNSCAGNLFPTKHSIMLVKDM